jgi:hypothetical protein
MRKKKLEWVKTDHDIDEIDLFFIGEESERIGEANLIDQ